ncbi:peptide chain release factor 3 [Rhizomicrobium sp. SCGC AG-212-E05]|nr:peptide chain release factor 3 [Rhizomicrobium sp. SCGC AG-212-E05]
MSKTPASEAARRRTFAIISHPDAGKTTLTEHLLLLGGAIHAAGRVKARGEARRAKSDWMKIEQERGISVTSAVMTFEYEKAVFNLLDTPGHEDFSEDTYRTLTAADSAVMVIDAAKGIEAQTRKLFEVCRLRDIPIMTFVNKMDREARDPFELLDEISDQLQIETAPMMWPAGMGQNFKGVQSLTDDRFIPFNDGKLDADLKAKLDEDVGLAREGLPVFDLATYREGHLSPVYFGSALKNFGVAELLDALARYAPPPRSQAAVGKPAQPGDKEVTGFVFKVQANMDPNHRDRVAFLRLASGEFRRNMKLKQSGTGKTIGIHNPILFFASERETVDEAWPGDIIGIPNHGVLRVGDTLSESGTVVFTGIPNFAPEILRRVRLSDPMKQKHLARALESLAEEGVTQVFKPVIGSQWIVGVVGALQLDVLKSRLVAEYDLDADLEASPYDSARWLQGSEAELEKFSTANRGGMATDRDGAPVFLAKSAWEIGYVTDRFPNVKFLKTRERHDVNA